jgi:hypothetical protein
MVGMRKGTDFKISIQMKDSELYLEFGEMK